VDRLRRRLLALLAGIAAVTLLGGADYLTSDTIDFEILFFAPVAFVAWAAGTGAALVVACFAVGAGMSTDLVLGRLGEAPLSTTWEAASRLLAYGAVIGFISTRAALRERERLIARLRRANDEIKTLRGLLPVCAWCARIRDDERGGRWEKIEVYVSERSEATFTHGICPECAEGLLAQLPQPAPPET
jgi:hypothetical protein